MLTRKQKTVNWILIIFLLVLSVFLISGYLDDCKFL